MIYSFRALLDKQPVILAGAVAAVVNFLVVAGVIVVDAKTVAGGNAALVAVLGLFVNSKTSNTAVLDELGDTTVVAAQEAARATVRALAPPPARARGARAARK